MSELTPYHKIRASVLLANESMRLKTPDINYRWLMRDAYDQSEKYQSLFVQEILETPDRADLLVEVVTDLLSTIGKRYRLVVAQRAGFNEELEMPQTRLELKRHFGISYANLNKLLYTGLRELSLPSSQEFVKDFYIDQSTVEIRKHHELLLETYHWVAGMRVRNTIYKNY